MPSSSAQLLSIDQVAVTRKELAELIAAREDFEEQSTKVLLNN